VVALVDAAADMGLLVDPTPDVTMARAAVMVALVELAVRAAEL